MASENTGFIVNQYTTMNGTKITRAELIDRIMNHLGSGPKTCGDLARLIKIQKQAIYNVLAWLDTHKEISKKKSETKNVLEYYKSKECLLADLLSPKPLDIEKQFKIKGRKKFHIDKGTSKSSGAKGITKYSQAYTIWEGVD